LGAGGFIGNHMVRRLKSEGYWVKGVDLKTPEFDSTMADEFVIADLRDPVAVANVFRVQGGLDEVYQFAADMGGAGFVFTGEHDADIMHNSAMINLNVLETMRQTVSDTGENKTKVFYSGSACMYPEHNQMDPDNPNLEESSAYPANPDSEYGWEKLFSERMCRHFSEDYGVDTRVARYHNVYGPNGTYEGGREKAPAALCRKVALAAINGEIEIWGDGNQTRSFTYIDDCISGTQRLMNSDFTSPLNIGSSEMVSVNELLTIIEGVSGVKLKRNYNLGAPQGVRGRNSDNTLVRDVLNWEPTTSLVSGIQETYKWIYGELSK
jgi:nucleoside-diphosphate-sugar epimerase